MPNFFELQFDYLIPLAVAVPIGLLFIFFVLSRGGNNRAKAAKAESSRPLFPPVTVVPKQSAPPAQRTPSKPVTSPGPSEPTFAGSPYAAFKNTEAMELGGLPGFGGSRGTADLDTVIDVTRVNAAKAILVVDDSAVPRVKLRKLFESQGYRVETANDGLQALEAIARTRFSIIITDLEMPNMDGFELIAAVQGSLDTENIPLIAITGHEEMQARVHDIQGLYGIFKKPWNDRELLKRVDVLASLHA